eukprot:14855864-Alexandrium_andersonii.AAC.1
MARVACHGRDAQQAGGQPHRQGPFRALPGPPPDGSHPKGESALTGQLAARLPRESTLAQATALVGRWPLVDSQ